jgi:hypothetical protein
MSTVTLEVTEEELWLMANLYPADTGLPMTVWVRPRSNEQHSARIKVCTVPGPRMLADHLVMVVLRPREVIPVGSLSAKDERAVNAWIDLNEAALRAHWDGLTSSAEFTRAMRRI